MTVVGFVRQRIPKWAWVSRPHPCQVADTIGNILLDRPRPTAHQAAALASAMMGAPLQARRLLQACRPRYRGTRAAEVHEIMETIEKCQAFVYMKAEEICKND